MQLLLEEFFIKVNKLSKGKTSISLFIIVKLMLYLLTIGIIGLFIYFIYTKKYWIIIILTGLVFLGEFAHYFRKYREKNIIKKRKINEENKSKEVLKIEKSKNKNLLKSKKVKNKTLLKKNKPKNKNMIDRQVNAIRV